MAFLPSGSRAKKIHGSAIRRPEVQVLCALAVFARRLETRCVASDDVEQAGVLDIAIPKRPATACFGFVAGHGRSETIWLDAGWPAHCFCGEFHILLKSASLHRRYGAR